MHVINTPLIFLATLVCCGSFEIASDIDGNPISPPKGKTSHVDITQLPSRITEMDNIELIVVVWIKTGCDYCQKLQPILEETARVLQQYPITFVYSNPSNITDPVASNYRSRYNIVNYPHITVFRKSMGGYNYNDDMSPDGMANALISLLQRPQEWDKESPATHPSSEEHSATTAAIIGENSSTFSAKYYLEAIKASPITVLVITSGLVTDWHKQITEETDSTPTNDNPIRRQYDGTQILLLDSRSNECHDVLFKAPGVHRWKVRSTSGSSDTHEQGPRCRITPTSSATASVNTDTNTRALEDEGEVYPQAWVLHWRDDSLIAPYAWVAASVMRRSKFGEGLINASVRPKDLPVTPEEVDKLLQALQGADTLYTSQGAKAVLEPPSTAIVDVHSVSDLYKGPMVAEGVGSAFVSVLLIYDRGHYVHPTHPINTENETMSIPEGNDLSLHILDTFTSAVEILRSGIHSDSSVGGRKEGGISNQLIAAQDAVYLRLDRMEEKEYWKHDAIEMFQLNQVPTVAIFEDNTAFERRPCTISPSHYTSASSLATAIRTVVESTDDGRVQHICGRGRKALNIHRTDGKGGVINATDIPDGELHKYLKKRPRGRGDQ